MFCPDGQRFLMNTVIKEAAPPITVIPELDVSSCGDNPGEARNNIQDAIRGFLGASEEMGALEEILEEGGYRLEGDPESRGRL